MKHTSRRSFLQWAAGAAAAFGLSDAISPRASAAALNRSVVCIYLVGGNDSNNMIVPLDSPAYDGYARGRGSLALAKDALLPIASQSANYGFHPNLPGLQELYKENALAVVANVGRVCADHAITCDSFDHTREMQVGYLPNAYLTIPWAVSGTTPLPALCLPHNVTLAAADADAARNRSLVRSIGASPTPDSLAATALGRQLSTVLAALKIGGVQQPAFLVPFPGFETNRDQLNAQAALFAELDSAVVAFYRALGDLGMADLVTIYTDTEFNRTLVPNQAGGTDHAWGGHQLAIGGAVLGGQIYGQFPSMVVGGADDVAGNGTWTPSTTNAQYAATLAYWYGQIDVSGLAPYASAAGGAGSRLGFLAT